MTSRRANSLLLACAAVLALACSVKPATSNVTGGSSGAPTVAQTGPAVAQIGQTITVGGGFGDTEIAATVFGIKTYGAAPDNGFIKPAKGTYAAVQIEVKVLKGKTYACACDFALVATDGSLFEPGWGVGFNQAMQNVTLNVGEKTSGVIVFDIPASAVKAAVIQFRPDWTNDIRGTWQT